MSVSSKIVVPQPYAPICFPSLPLRRLPPSSLSFVPGNQAKSIASLKFAYKTLFARGRFATKNSAASPSPVVCCLLAGEGKPDRDNLGFRWESFERAADGFRPEGLKPKKSVEEMLQEQIRRRRFSAGGSGQKLPGGGGGQGGGRGGGGDDSGGGGGVGDEGSFGFSDEALQVILATIGFIFMYIYVIHGMEINRLGKDCVKYLRTGTKSARLKKFMGKWGSFLQFLLATIEHYKPQFEREIGNAASRFSGITKYKHRLRLHQASHAEQ